MIAFRSHDEHRHADILQRRRTAIDHEAAGCKLVVEVEALQIFSMHPIGHARGIGIPRHKVVHPRAFAHEIVVDQSRPDEVVALQYLKGTRHLVRRQITPIPHHAFEEMHLARVDEERQFAGFGKIRLGCEKGERCQPPVAGAPHRSRRDREKRATQAIARRMDPAVGNDGGDHVERGHDTQTAIIVQREIAIVCPRVSPGNGEDRVPLPDQIAHQGILRRQVKDVVFHDPGRHDQHRLRHNGVGCGTVLDQFDQMVSEDDLSGSDRDIPPRYEPFRARGRATARKPVDIFEPVLKPREEVCPTSGDGFVDHLGIGERIVGWREHVEHLPRGEGDHVLVVRSDAWHLPCRIVPPLLGEQERLSIGRIGEFLPRLPGEAVVARQGLDAAWSVVIETGGAEITRQPGAFPHGLVGKFQTLSRRRGQMDRPVEQGQRQCRRRKPASHPRAQRLAHPIDCAVGFRVESVVAGVRRLDVSPAQIIHCGSRLIGTAVVMV